MPRGFMDNLEGEVADEKFHKRTFGHDILSADLNCEKVILLNIGYHRISGVAHDLTCLICGKRVGKVPKPFFNVVSECVPALVGDLDIAVGYTLFFCTSMVFLVLLNPKNSIPLPFRMEQERDLLKPKCSMRYYLFF